MKSAQTHKFIFAALMASTAFVVIAPHQAAAQSVGEKPDALSLPAQPLEDAVIAIGREFGVIIVAPDALVGGRSAPPISEARSADDALRKALAGSGLTADQNASGGFVIAQQVAAAEPTADPVDTVVVTGSRLERTAINSPSPIDVVTAEDIAVLGLTDTTEALRFTPALQQSVSLATNGNPFDGEFEFGQATLDLRGLGANRTLVLVNGRRHVGGVANEATVDVASIPAALLDRVEVLTGGGSSIYGADAGSGVVNYVLKDDFEGVDFRSNVSLPTAGGR